MPQGLAAGTLLVALLALAPAARAGEDCWQGRICVASEQSAGAVTLTVHNRDVGDATVTLEARLENMRADRPLPVTLVVPGQASRMAARISVVQAGQPWRWSYSWRFLPGSRDARPDGTLYRLPYAAGVTYRVLQGYGGAYSHRGELHYAIDFDLPEGTPVHAARGGLVVGTRADSTAGGASPSFKDQANYVRVRHADATIGEYLHLRPGGVSVRRGQQVGTGELLGYSGNTGYSTRAHLHFHVSRPIDGTRWETLPVRFAIKGAPVTLEEGRSYASEAPVRSCPPVC